MTNLINILKKSSEKIVKTTRRDDADNKMVVIKIANKVHNYLSMVEEGLINGQFEANDQKELIFGLKRLYSELLSMKLASECKMLNPDVYTFNNLEQFSIIEIITGKCRKYEGILETEFKATLDTLKEIDTKDKKIHELVYQELRGVIDKLKESVRLNSKGDIETIYSLYGIEQDEKVKASFNNNELKQHNKTKIISELEVITEITSKTIMNLIFTLALKSKEAERKKIKSLNSRDIVQIDNLYFPSTSASKHLTTYEVNKEVEHIIDEDKGIKTVVCLVDENENNQNTLNKINYLDKLILNIFCTYNESNQMYISKNMVLKALKGGITKKEYTTKQIEEVEKSINKMRFTRITIDATKEGLLRNWGEDQKTKFDGYLLPLEVVEIETNGKKVEYYQLLKTPEIYEYAKATHQIRSIKIEILKHVKSGMEEIGSYLIERIESIRRHKTLEKKKGFTNNKIAINTIFEKCNIEIKTKQQKSRIIKRIKSMIEEWVTIQYIKGVKYHETNTNTLTNIEIDI